MAVDTSDVPPSIVPTLPEPGYVLGCVSNETSMAVAGPGQF